MCALLIDLDGTLANSDGLHFTVFQQFCVSHVSGFQLTETEFEKYIHGRSNSAIFPYLFGKELSDAECQHYADEKEAKYREQVAEKGVEAILGGKDFILWAKSLGIKVAIVTNAPRANAECVLTALRLDNAFDCLVIGEECTESKPSPVPYLEGARRLGVNIDNCVVFEDSPAGLAAAVAAGPAGIVGITSTLEADRLRNLGAEYTAENFSANDLKDYVLAKLKRH